MLMQLDRKKLPTILTEDLSYTATAMIDSPAIESAQNSEQNLTKNQTPNLIDSISNPHLDSFINHDINQRNDDDFPHKTAEVASSMNEPIDITLLDDLRDHLVLNEPIIVDVVPESNSPEPATYFLLNELGEPNF